LAVKKQSIGFFGVIWIQNRIQLCAEDWYKLLFDFETLKMIRHGLTEITNRLVYWLADGGSIVSAVANSSHGEGSGVVIHIMCVLYTQPRHKHYVSVVFMFTLN